VQPNVDLGLLACTVTHLNSEGGTIESGPVTLRDNIASSTMTTSDLSSEWNKTYGPIFTSAPVLCEKLKPEFFESFKDETSQLVKFIKGMQLDHYLVLFGENTSPQVAELFKTMKTFRGADDAERANILKQIKAQNDGIFSKVDMFSEPLEITSHE